MRDEVRRDRVTGPYGQSGSIVSEQGLSSETDRGGEAAQPTEIEDVR